MARHARLFSLVLAAALALAACVGSPTGEREPAQRVPASSSTAPSNDEPDSDAGPSDDAAADTGDGSGDGATTTTVEAGTTIPVVTGAGDAAAGVERSNPVEIGAYGAIGDWVVRVTNVDADATSAVLAASEFNEAPDPGQQYVMVDLEAAYAGGDVGTFWFDVSWSAVGPAGVVYESFDASCGTLPSDLSYGGELWPGGVLEGQLCFAVDASDAAELELFFDEGFSDDTRRYFALRDGVGSVPGVEPPAVPPVDTAGDAGTRGNPLAIGSFADLGEWFVRVDAVNPDAADVIDDNFLNDPAPAGSRYVLADITVGYFGTEPDQSTSSLNLRALGPNNVATDTWSASCGFLDNSLDAVSLFPGGVASGAVCFVVDESQLNGLTLVVESFESSRRIFTAIEPGVGESNDVELPAAPEITGGVEGSWTNPLPASSVVTVGDWEIEITDVQADATDVVLAESGFNDPPPDGRQFVLVGLSATYTGADSASFWSSMTWSILGSKRVAYTEFDSYCGSIPDDIANASEVFAGATVEGNVCLSVASDAADSMTLVLEDFVSFDDPVYVAIR